MTTPSRFRFARRALLALVPLCVSLAALGSTDSPRSFDLPADTADRSLRRFSEQSGIEIVFATQVGRRVRTAPVKGEMTADDALARMLADTGLVAIRDEKTGALTVRADNTAESKNVPSRLGESETARARDGVIKLEELAITGTRIRSNLAGQGTQPVSTISEEDIARYGITNLGALFRYIPQVTSASLGFMVQTNTTTPLQAGTTSGRITAGLRGAPAGGTLLLVNGRRAPKNGQVGGGDAYDIAGIPIAAIERVEVLLDGASAIYGADAIGGVINVILKKNYRGSEVRLSYENAFDTDVSVKAVSLSHGFAAGKLTGIVTAAWEEASSMAWRDRDFLRTVDRRPWGGTDNRGISDGRGYLQAVSGNLPGLSVNRVIIPPGSTGVGLTVADYVAAQSIPDQLRDDADYMQYSTPYERKSVAANLEFAVNDRLQLFGEARWGESTTESTSTPILALSTRIPAGAPGNPFGVPVNLNKNFFDLPLQVSTSTTRNIFYLAGVRGELPGDWRYEATASRTQSLPDLTSRMGLFLQAPAVAAAFAVPAQGPVLVYDSTSVTARNPAGVIEALTSGPRNAERIDTWIYDVKADGKVWSLPAGDLRAAAGAEYREEYVDFPQRTAGSVGPEARNRYVTGLFAEALIPVLSAEQGIPFVDRIEANLSVRQDRYSDFASATNPRYGLLFRPVKWVMLRGSYGEGYKVPTLSQLYSPFLVDGGLTFVSGVPDPLRGNEAISGIIFFDTGGNPLLKPERSRNTTAGIVVQVPGVKDVTVALDYWNTDYVERVGGITLADRLVLFPATVQRGPKLPTDPASWAGPVVKYADLAVNIAQQRLMGYDLTVKARHAVRENEFNAHAAVSYVTRNEIRALPGQPITTTSSKHALPLQGVASLFWARDAFEMGAIATYRGRSRGSTVATVAFTPSSIRWDWQCSYDFAAARADRADRRPMRLLGSSRVSLTIFNVLDTEPPFTPQGFPDNTIVDSRLRRYALQLSTRF